MEEPEMLAKHDWRINKIAFAPPQNVFTDGKWIQAPTVLSIAASGKYGNRDVSFPIPNATALFLELSYESHQHSMEKIKAAIETGVMPIDSKGGLSISDTEAFGFFQAVMASVVFAYTALEAFVNEEIPDAYVHMVEEKQFTRQYDKVQIERFLNLPTKLGDVLPEALAVKSPKGTTIWENFRQLNATRDRIIHLKSDDRHYRHDTPTPLWTDLIVSPLPENYRIAKEMIGYFFLTRDKIPRWFAKCPF